MGLLHSRSPAPRLVMTGLDSAGKTTILGRLEGSVEMTIPTIGFNVEVLESKNLQLWAWDVGGSQKSGPLLRHYYQKVQGSIFVIDSTDRERLSAATLELSAMLEEHELDGKPLLVLANKQDLPNALHANDVADKLRLNEIRQRPWYITGVCATTGEGVLEGLDWIMSRLREGTTPLHVEQDNMLPIQLGLSMVVMESIKVWTTNQSGPFIGIPPSRFDVFGDNVSNQSERQEGTKLRIAEIMDYREVLMGILCRTEGPDSFWFQYVPGVVRPDADFLVSVQSVSRQAGGSSLLCSDLSGNELGVFDILDDRPQRVADLALFLSQQHGRISHAQLKFVLEDGRLVDGFPGHDPLSILS